MNERKISILHLKFNIISIKSILLFLIFLLNSSCSYEYIMLNNTNNIIIKQNERYTYNNISNKEPRYTFEEELEFPKTNNDGQEIFYFINNLPHNNTFFFIKNNIYIFSSDGEYIKNTKLFAQPLKSFYKIIFPYKYISINNFNLYYYIVIYNNCKNNIIIDVYEYDFYFNLNRLFLSKEVNISKSFKEVKISGYNKFDCKLISTKNNEDKALNCIFRNNKNKNIISKIFKIDIENKLINDISKYGGINSNNLLDKNNILNNNNKFFHFLRNLQNPPDAGDGQGSQGGPGEGSGGDSQEGREEGSQTGSGEGGGPGEGSGEGPNSGGDPGPEVENTGIGGNNNGDQGNPNNDNPQQNPGNGEGGGKKDFNFDFEKGKTNMTREEIRNNRDSIMENYEKGNSYRIEGEGFEIRVAPMNEKGEQGSPSIDFLACEAKLRQTYGLNESAVLSVFQTQTERTNQKSLTNKIEYVVYDENNTQLNLSVCENEPIKINFPIRNNTNLNTSMLSNFADKGIDILNSSDPFFNDICYTYSDGGSDIILKDRISEIYQNFSVCDSGCEYDSIDTGNMTISCTCTVSNDTDSDDDEDESTNLKSIILNLFDDSTFGVVKCHKLVFNLNNKLKNIGFWIFSVIILGHIPLYILFLINGIVPIKQYIVNEMKKYHYFISIENPPKKKKKIEKEQEKNNLMSNQVITTNIKNQEIEGADNRFNGLYSNSKNGKNSNIILIQDYNLSTNNKNTDFNENIISINDKTSKINEKNAKETYFLIKLDANNYKINIKPPDSNYTLKNYEYETALAYENRSFWRILYILFLAKDNILNTFILKSPLESKPLRICLLLFSYTSDLALNTLFYFSDNISDKYHYTGNYLFWYTLFNNILICVISTLLSIILGSILSSMTNSKSRIEDEFKKEEEKMRENKDYVVSEERKGEIIISIQKCLKCLKIKMVIFIVADFIILLFFYYFTTAFCSVYQGTQTSWISDAIVSIIISFPVEIIISLVITIIYKISLKYKCKLLYKLSMIIA